MKTRQQVNIEEVWKRFHKAHSDESRNSLLEYYASIVKYTAERLHSKLPDKVEVDDLISAGNFGLMDAIDAFDPERGVKFETYCAPRIRGSILDELRSMDWVPRLVRARAHQLTKATQALEVHLGRKPTEQETAQELDMKMEEFDRLQRDANAVSLVSLNTKYSEGDGEKDNVMALAYDRMNELLAKPVEHIDQATTTRIFQEIPGILPRLNVYQ